MIQKNNNDPYNLDLVDSGQGARFPAILSLSTASPAGRYSQREIYETLAHRWESYRHPRVGQVFMNSDIAFRHLCIDVEKFTGSESIDELHTRFVTGATEMGMRAIRSALAGAGITAHEIDFLVAATCTGYICPGLSAIYAKELGRSGNLQRADLVGMGCAGALPSMQRAVDFARANPGKKALVVTAEVCSACYYLDDTLETMIGNAICADGAAAMVVGVPNHAKINGGDKIGRPRIIGFRTLLDPAYIDTVGFQHMDGRLRIVLSKDLRHTAGGLARKVIDEILEEHDLKRDDIAHWIVHPGGTKIIDAIQAELALSDDQVQHSSFVLKNFGNMSSPTVLFVLQAAMQDPSRPPTPGDYGIMLAMGPGLAVEGALLRW